MSILSENAAAGTSVSPGSCHQAFQLRSRPQISRSRLASLCQEENVAYYSLTPTGVKGTWAWSGEWAATTSVVLLSFINCFLRKGWLFPVFILLNYVKFETEQSKMFCSSGFKAEHSCNHKALPLWPSLTLPGLRVASQGPTFHLQSLISKTVLIRTRN